MSAWCEDAPGTKWIFQERTRLVMAEGGLMSWHWELDLEQVRGLKDLLSEKGAECMRCPDRYLFWQKGVVTSVTSCHNSILYPWWGKAEQGHPRALTQCICVGDWGPCQLCGIGNVNNPISVPLNWRLQERMVKSCKCFYSNARNLKNSIVELHYLAINDNPDIKGISRWWKEDNLWHT